MATAPMAPCVTAVICKASPASGVAVIVNEAAPDGSQPANAPTPVPV